MVAWIAALAALLLSPIRRAGYLLGHDMVFTPRQPLDLASIGLSSASPRAVPLDALVAIAERVADGALVGRVAVVAPVFAAGLGVAVLLSSRSLPARLAAGGFAVWNAYFVERMALGQWALLWAYAALPWIVLAVNRGRGRGGWFARALAIAAASITPTGGLIATASAVTVSAVGGNGRRETLRVAALAVALQLPWVVAAVVSPAAATSDPAAVAAFAARAEHSGGVALSLLTGGGIWDSEVVPGSRAGVLAWLTLAALIAAAVFGWRRLSELLGARLLAALTGLAAAGVVVALASSVPGGDAVMRSVVAHVPGAGLLRDSQKWIMPLVLLEALLVGADVDRIAAAVHARHVRVLVGIAAACLPILLLPDAAATMRPTFEPVHYPRDWSAVVAAARRGDAAVLPFESYRLFAWAPGRSVLDPAPRLIAVPAVVDDRLAVAGKVLRGEDTRARQVDAALTAAGKRGTGLAAGLARLGVTWVILEHGTPGPVPDFGELVPVHIGTDVSLYRVPGPHQNPAVQTWRVVGLVAADALAVLVVLGAGVAAVRRSTIGPRT